MRRARVESSRVVYDGAGERVLQRRRGHRVILRVISHNRLEEGHHDDRCTQYRPCPRSCTSSWPRRSPDLMRELLDHVHQRAAVGAGRHRVRRRLRRTQPRSGSTAATATGTATWTPGSAPWTWRSRSCAGVVLPGLAAGAPPAGRAGADHRWWRPATCSGSRPGGWTSWCSPWASPACRKSQVSEMAKDLDEHVEQFRTRRLRTPARTRSWPPTR